jgi:endonuclease-3
VNAAKRRKIYERFARANPEPRTELNYRTPFELLVAVVLSAQATDASVNKATARLFAVASTPDAILRLGEEGLKSYIKTIGLFNSKAKNLIRTCATLVAEHGGEVPRDRETLESLPGVGRKTANVILNTAFGEATIAVDTHIFRVANRIGLAPGLTVRAVEDELVRVTPDEFKRHAHHWLILHGRYVCKARKPECPRCLIVDLCEYPSKTPSEAFSIKALRA